ncbi:DUF3043 domain-containing protein [Streptomyces sp. NBS 14/10]|uniref:DUF3043 domain-containing protein n=1 Tax=Streptomyces sp. NBS 14/10 TaxID=1945643 RepID=UPI0015C58666|nr:DUF3043 domain-containing protein [Streptomyces sp. NBS 14/10]KAK1178596.1 DUF3043 domain-containing protein [Streptomyces sp. NBS 14/10]NUP44644.1 DUF3043 domain-containing protein [Streptomyces sp.]NUS89965.1 DUF3043 domain-containing protein [Streptomyces sp.]
MFRSRSKDEQAATAKVIADQPQQTRDPQAPKGRPTPKRSEAQSQRRSLANSSSKMGRKDATRRQRESRRADLARQREALAGGDERYLPARDKGPVRRFARDYVDSRFFVAEFFLPLAVVILVLSMVQAGAMQTYVLLLWMLVILLIVINSVVLGIQLKRQLRKRFPDENLRGVVAYALMRTLQMRRLRLPKPQVKRGERP